VEGQQRRLLRLIIWGHLGYNFDKDAFHTDWSMEKVASQKMLLFYSDAEGCYEIDFYHNLFCYWLVGNGESYLKVGEDGSRAEELWMFPSLATTTEPGKRINNNLKRLVETPKSTPATVTVPGLSLNHTGGSFRIGAMSQMFAAPSCNMSKRCRCCFRT
jgi:hypothetical protein